MKTMNCTPRRSRIDDAGTAFDSAAIGTDNRYSTQRSIATERISAVMAIGIRPIADSPTPTPSAPSPNTHVVMVVQRRADATIT